MGGGGAGGRGTYVGRGRHGVVALDCVGLAAGEDHRPAHLGLRTVGNGGALRRRLRTTTTTTSSSTTALSIITETLLAPSYRL